MMSEGRLERMQYTGRFFETDNFGESLAQDAGYTEYVPALEDVKKNQPWDPADPKPRFANDLHAEVATELLGLEGDWSEVRFYTAIGSALDHYHGVDGFFEFGDARVTMDITQNPAKESGYKADFIIGPEEVEYEKRRQEKAQEIAEALRERKEAAAQRHRRSGQQPLRKRL